MSSAVGQVSSLLQHRRLPTKTWLARRQTDENGMQAGVLLVIRVTAEAASSGRK